ncbi:glycosyltransferase family 2 protein [Pontibacter mangrovi]|uniref:Glycosyltransferase family 2 protein n=1 Tax=Pontibacter mangrovi TaxID=2589816 RepID=A0A501WAB1_9BACT|nr:glycosyltransferase family 2 protein [Pontibacter mangrovi]TPE42516.1 glycosyltransferase family 2 protein [Pontibacter mangrovi]
MFSIIIPLYNKEASIGATLRTVLGQTFPHFEVLVVNDGSTDSSLSVVASFSDPRIRVLSKPNGGVSHARNYGIERAQHEYIAFLDADDLWEPNYLEEMNRLIQKYPDCGMYSCAYKCIKQDKVLIERPNIPEGKLDDYFKAILINSKISWTSATVIRKEAFEKAGMFPVGMVSGEDSYMWCKTAIHYPVAFSNKILATYNLSMSQTHFRVAAPDHCQESWYDLYSEGEQYRNQFIASKAIENGLRHAWGGHRKRSRLIEQQFWFARKFNDKNLQKRLKQLYYLNRLPRIAVRFLLVYKRLVTIYSYKYK